MNRTLINFWLDSLLMVLFLLALWTTFVLRFLFPPGTLAQGWTLWSWNFDQWSNFQFIVTSILGLGILVHVMLHWKWVCGVLTSKILRRSENRGSWDDGVRTLVGVGLMIVLLNVLGAAFAAAALTMQSPVQ